MITIKRGISTALVATLALLAVAIVPATGTAKSDSALRSYHGKVTRISQENNAFRMRLNSGSSKRFRVNGSTRFERIAGFGGLAKGLRIEVKAVKGSNLARKIEPENGTSGGGDDRGGASKGVNSSDDPSGDDHGSGGHGSDVPPGDDHGTDDGPGDDHGSHHGDDDDDDHGNHHGDDDDDHGSDD